MDVMRDFQQHIHTLVSQELYTEALGYFKSHKQSIDKNQIAQNQYLVADILLCLRKTEAWDAAGKFLNIYNVSINAGTPERVLIAWILHLYDWYKSINKEITNKDKVNDSRLTEKNKSESHRLVEQFAGVLTLLLGVKNDFALNFYNTLVFKVLKTESQKEQTDWALVKTFCSSVEKQYLSKATHEVQFTRNNKNKSSELASVTEEWYVQYTKSLYATGDYVLCIEQCKQALIDLPKTHYSNDVWFARRIALSFKKLGNINEAIAQFEPLTKVKGDWFLLAELADLYRTLGDNKKAMELMLKAVSLQGKLSYKVELIEQLGEIYNELNDQSTSLDYYRLAYYVRKSEGWNIDPQLNIKANLSSPSEDYMKEKVELEHKLIKRRNSIHLDEVRQPERYSGKIIKVFTPKDVGTDVLIQQNDGTKIYAFISKDDPINNNLAVGLSLSYEVKKVPEKKFDKAIRLKLL